MKRSLLALGALVIAASLSACDAKPDGGEKPGPVKSYKEYVDPAVNFKVSYPDGWVTSITAGSRAIFYSSNEIADGFATFEPKGNHGAKIEVMAKAGDPSMVETMIGELKEVFTDPNAVKAPEQTTVNGLPATKVSYSAGLGESGTFTAERYFIVT